MSKLRNLLLVKALKYQFRFAFLQRSWLYDFLYDNIHSLSRELFLHMCDKTRWPTSLSILIDSKFCGDTLKS